MAKVAAKAPEWRPIVEAGRDGRLVAEAFETGQEAEAQPVPESLHLDLRQALGRVGIESLYSHQLEALEAAGRGHTIVTTGTASGKSLCFNLPVLDGLARDPKQRALYLYPTKALAQDQARKLAELGPSALRLAIYDGDTPQEERPQIRRRANVVLTNPDMLHVGILPNHSSWGDFFANLAWVVVDEAHIYRGVFGSHVGNVLRRLRRVASIYRSQPTLLMTSATIANPVELAERLSGEDFGLVDSDGAPRAGRQIAMWNPPLIDEAAMVRRSPLSEAADLLAELVANGVRTICFLKSRRGIELILRIARLRLEEEGHGDLVKRIAPYRAGYTPQQRREIESKLSAGELLAVVATNALELGIDVGELDAAICVTFPGTVASLRQMWGRAGRRQRGLAMYVAGQDALDQFFCRHPDEFLERPVEAAILDHENEQIYMQHLVCAAHEAPLEPGDENTLGPRWQAWADRLVAAGELRRTETARKARTRGGPFYLPRKPHYPAARVSLRSASADTVAVVERDAGELIGTVEAERALSTLHPGAVYMHLGRAYEVQGLDLDSRHASVREFDGSFYTQPKKDTETYIEEIRDVRQALGVELHFGVVSVSEQVIAFQRKRIGDNEVIDLTALDLPEQSFVTQALWYPVSEEVLGDMPPEVLLGSLHAAEHSQIAVLPLIAMCDRWDIGGLSTNVHFQTGRPTIFIYDGYPGGVGLTLQAWRQFETLVADAARLIGECPCVSGCPSCVQSPKCGNLNDPLHKAGSLELMSRMLSRDESGG